MRVDLQPGLEVGEDRVDEGDVVGRRRLGLLDLVEDPELVQRVCSRPFSVIR